MIDPFEEEIVQNRTPTSAVIAQEMRQFKKLQHLSDHEVAHRMATTPNNIRALRKARNQLNRTLIEIKLDYQIRVILGAHGIKTTGQLFRLSDRDLLAMENIGRVRLAAIRERLQEFFS